MVGIGTPQDRKREAAEKYDFLRGARLKRGDRNYGISSD